MGNKDISNYIKIGERIKNMRIETGMTQKEFANKLDIPVSTYSNYENGNRVPNNETLNKIAEILGISPLKFFYPDEILYAFFSKRLSGKMSKSEIRGLFENIVEHSKNISNTLYPILSKSPNDIPEDEEETAMVERINKIIEHLDKLTEEGQEEAVKRVGELTEIPRFQKPEQSE